MYRVEPLGDPPADEAGWFERYPSCGRWLDVRDLGEILEHEVTCDGIWRPH